MSSLMEALGRAKICVEPDYLVLVEREIHLHENAQYVSHETWNEACRSRHAEVFAELAPDLPEIIEWVSDRFHARIYADAYSPFCLIAGTNGDADVIHKYLEDYCRKIPQLTVV